MGSPRILMHVDMDAFYAAVEARNDPRLAHVPLVIGADPKGGRGRGVVATANYPARRYGIRSAMPIGQAYDLCPHAVFLRPDFTKYAQASRDVMRILGRYADVLEVVGIDEAYLDVTDRCQGDVAFAGSLARSLQAAVLRETGLSCSVGVAPSKSVAKIASDRRKPMGVTVVAPDDVTAFLSPLPVRLLHGCGPKTAAALAESDVASIADLAAADPRWLESRFGSHGRWLRRVARGEDPRAVRAARPPRKSRGNERTFERDERHPAHLFAVAHRLLNELLEDARRDGRPFSTITVKVRYGDFTTLTRASTVPVALDPAGPATARQAEAAADALLAPLLDGRPVRLLGIRFSTFHEDTGQAPLARFGLALPPPALAGRARRGSPVGHRRQLVLADAWAQAAGGSQDPLEASLAS